MHADNTPNAGAMKKKNWYYYCCAWACCFMVKTHKTDNLLVQLAYSQACKAGIVFW